MIEAEKFGGNAPDKKVSREIDYLVIGNVGSKDWKYSRYGNKIEKAIELRKEYGKLKIITEEQFIEAVLKTERSK